MAVTDKYARVGISEIIVDRDARQRRAFDTSDLEPSIKRNGVLQPIIIDAARKLIAGERRLIACKKLVEAGIARDDKGQPLDTIPIRFVEDLSDTEAQIIELSENVKRLDLDWKDTVNSVGRIHGLFIKLDSGWTIGETAVELSLNRSTVSLYLKVFSRMDDERVQRATTVREAYNLLDRRDARAAGEALQEILEMTNEVIPHVEVKGMELLPNELAPLPAAKPEPRPVPLIIPAEQTILLQSFLDWAPAFAGRKFNFVHCDFPYGVNLFAGTQSGSRTHTSYADSDDVYFALLECFCKNLDRFMAVSAHLMFWFSAKNRARTMDTFARLAPTLQFYPFDLVWTKSDNAGIAADPKHGPRHVYETALLGSRGARQVVKVVSDAYSAPTDKRYHVSTKPEPMLKHFMSMLVDENTSILDPTCGSATSIRAAEELGAIRALGMDIEPETVEVARMALKNARTLRAASKVTGL